MNYSERPEVFGVSGHFGERLIGLCGEAVSVGEHIGQVESPVGTNDVVALASVSLSAQIGGGSQAEEGEKSEPCSGDSGKE